MIKRNDAYYYKGLLLILALYIQFLFYVNFRESTIFYGCYISLFSLPDPVRDREDNRNVFSEERAWKHLEYFDSTGYNILGTYENEVLVPNYILKELEKLKNNKFNWIVEIDTQKVTGSYYSNFLDSYINAYSDVTNIIVNVYHSSLLKEYPTSNGIPSVLINAHFDSAIISKGASDDLSAVAIMLELINNIVNTNRTISHKMTFLFNGAEEPFLQGAHGFIYNHPWSKDVRAFINLESIGSGGSSLLFEYSDQTSWMIKTYKKVVRNPHVSSFGQDFFDWHIIPAETDYEIFKQYKYRGDDNSGDDVLRKYPLPGVDFAWYKNGYVYHSLTDDINHVEKGQLQYLGETLLPFILETANSPELDNSLIIDDDTKSKGFTSSPLFTDIFRQYLIVVERPMLYLVLFILTVITIKQCYKNMKLYTIFLKVLFKSIFVGLMYFLIFSLFLIYALSRPFSWFSNRWLSLLLYSPPFFYGFIKTLEVEKYKLCKLGYSLRDIEIHSYFGISLFLAIFSLMFASFNSILFGLLLPCWIFSLAIGTLKEYLKKQVKEITILANMIYSLPMAIVWSEPFYELMCILPPISGRIGERSSFFHEAIIYFPVIVCFSLITMLICLPTLVRIENNRNIKIVLISLLSTGIIFSFILPIHTIETPKRIYPVHLHKWKSIDSAIETNNNNNNNNNKDEIVIRSDFIFGMGDGVKNDEIYKLFGFNNNKFDWQKNLRSYISIDSEYLQKVMSPFHKMIGGLTIQNTKPYNNFVMNYRPVLNITSYESFDRNELTKYHDNIMKEKYIRKVEVNVNTIDAGWSIITIPSKSLYSWSYNKPLPKPVNNQYLIRHDGGLKANNFKFDLYFNSKEKVNVTLSTCYTSNHLKRIDGKMGDIIDDLLTNEYEYLQISPQICGTIDIIV